MKILITGGNGFIGSYFARDLANNGHQVFSASRQEMDCSDPEAVKKYLNKINPEVIIHTAAKIMPTDEMHGNHDQILHENQILNSIILKQASLVNIKDIICFGSHTMYSSALEKEESNILSGETPSFIKGYADSKRRLLKLCQEFNVRGFNYKMLVLPSVYGPFNPSFAPKQMLNSIILRAQKTKKANKLELEVRGNLKALREYVFLPDISQWIVKNLINLKKIPPVMNLGSESILQILDYYKICAKIFKLNIKFDEKNSKLEELDHEIHPLNCSLALNYGWGLSTSIEQGILQTINHIEINNGI